ncbi:MAG: hypothetical protein H6P96_102 [Candidatus Aminicenantes bacterium]|nr:hypothetical protein [Candidatus Aminicenantes bacterium]
MRCSKRWAKPVLPATSFFEPTWYQTLKATMGALWSSWTIKVNPLSRVNFWKGMSILAVWAARKGAARTTKPTSRTATAAGADENLRMVISFGGRE